MAVVDIPQVEDSEVFPESPGVEEVSPAERKPSAKLLEMFRPKGKSEETPDGKEKRPGSNKTKRIFKRKPAAEIYGIPFEIGAEIAAIANKPATATMLAIQSPYAGHILDQALAGTIVDRVLVQPAARGQDRFGALMAVFAPPLIVMSIERNPQRAPALVPLLKRSLRMSAPFIAEGLKKKRIEEEKLQSVIEELYPTAPEGSTALDVMIMEILAPLMQRGPETEMSNDEQPE